ncbi:acyl-CoA dehydrogenase family protein [Streptomyces sp. NBC_00988]|uniref:acyl-CoA dehydrogenase family protein n=1 Tax=Streptomyces sp. NBC_00988 TaxID=2903704 RepID=UPI00386818CF|nr:acyl-CoA dehydrogenase family protein [Streptomyces sp. NBC_00988]
MTRWTPPQYPTAGLPSAGEDIVRRARDLVPLLRSHADRADRERIIPEAVIRALDEAGMWQLTVPRRFSGHETDITTFVRAVTELGRGCGSAAWVTMISNAVSWFVGMLPGDAQKEVFGARPNVPLCSVKTQTPDARRVEEGIVVSGRWTFASNSLNAEWTLIGVPVLASDGTWVEAGQGLVPMSDITVEDTWDVTGMRGTGSNTLVADEIFIPDHRVLPLDSAGEGGVPTEFSDETLYQSAYIPVLALIPAAPLLGLATTALELSLERLPKRPVAYTGYKSSADSPTVQLAVAEASAKIDMAYLCMWHAAEEIDAVAKAHETMPLLDRARIRRDVAFITRSCQEAVEILLDANGASCFAHANPLQRIWRDVETGSRHGMLVPGVNLEVYGRALLGADLDAWTT